MSRRSIPEINAGSMADIAFLLLIFWLVTTTIDSDEGIQRQLPPMQPPIENPPVVKQRNIYVVLVNGKDQLLVEGELMKISKLKEGAKEFLIANGDGLRYPNKGDVENFPIRTRVSKTDVVQKVADYTKAVEDATDENTKKAFEKELKKWEEKASAIRLLGGDYYELPSSALISMQNDNNTTYDMYIQVQNELQAAVNELRDEVSLDKFGITYDELKTRYERKPDDIKLAEQIEAVRSVYPQRISEAEPNETGNMYGN